jgi:hypothetical protein
MRMRLTTISMTMIMENDEEETAHCNDAAKKARSR